MPEVTSARAVSIFIRPPRPCPSWRRASSLSRSSGRSSRPAGSPSTIAVRPGPCDSPAVVKRSAIGLLPYWRFWALLGAGEQPGDREQIGQHPLTRVGDRLAAGHADRLRVLRGRVLDLDRAQLLELEVVRGQAVERRERLLVLVARELERDEAAVLVVVAVALALRR